MALGALVCYLVVTPIADSSSVYRPGTYLFAAGDVLFLTSPVVAWMICRGHSTRHSLEMGIAMLAPVAAIVAVGELASFAYLEPLVIAGYPALSLGMLVYMLHRRRGPTPARFAMLSWPQKRLGLSPPISASYLTQAVTGTPSAGQSPVSRD
jgi:hypothetical protein